MAFLREGIGDNDSDIKSVSLSREIFGAVRWAAIPCAVVFVASWSAATVAGLHTAASRAATESFLPVPMTTQSRVAIQAARQPRVAGRMESAPEAHIETASVAAPMVNIPADPFAAVVASANLSREKLAAAFAGASVTVADPADPFARVVAEADLSRDKLLAAFAGAGLEIADARAGQTFELAALPASDTQPADDPFAHLALGPTDLPGDLAYAAAEAGPDDPVELALASLGDDPLDAEPFEMEPGIDAAIEAETMPESVDLPPARPSLISLAPLLGEVAWLPEPIRVRFHLPLASRSSRLTPSKLTTRISSLPSRFRSVG